MFTEHTNKTDDITIQRRDEKESWKYIKIKKYNKHIINLINIVKWQHFKGALYYLSFLWHYVFSNETTGEMNQQQQQKWLFIVMFVTRYGSKPSTKLDGVLERTRGREAGGQSESSGLCDTIQRVCVEYWLRLCDSVARSSVLIRGERVSSELTSSLHDCQNVRDMEEKYLREVIYPDFYPHIHNTKSHRSWITWKNVIRS